MKLVGKIVAFAALALGLCGAGNAQNLVKNPGFETGDLSSWTVTDPTGGYAWAVSSSLYGLLPNSGSFFVDTGCIGTTCLAASATATIPNVLSQTLTTVAGQTYSLSFFVANEAGALAPSELDVYWGGTLVTAISPLSSNPGYSEYTFSGLTASTTSTSLAFLGRQDPGYFALDDISVTAAAVPEPSTYGLMLAGLGLLGVVARRRKVVPA